MVIDLLFKAAVRGIFSFSTVWIGIAISSDLWHTPMNPTDWILMPVGFMSTVMVFGLYVDLRKK